MKNTRWLAVAGVGLVLASGVRAQNISWTNTAGGSFGTAENWSPNAIPGATDTAVFTNQNANYTVTLNENATVTRIVVDPLNISPLGLTFDLNGYTLAATATLTSLYNNVAGSLQTRNLTIMSSTPGGVLTLPNLRSSSVQVTGTNNFTLTGSNLLVQITGASGDNNLNVTGHGLVLFSDGVTVTTTRPLLLGTGSTVSHPTSMWIVTDPGTTITNSASSGLFVGKSGTNMPTMIISNGATYYVAATHTANLAQGGDSTTSFSTNANGRMIITGVGSHFTTTTFNVTQRAGNGQLTKAGYAGTAGGFLVVEKGATVGVNALNLGGGIAAVNTRSVILTNDLAYGEMIIRDTGSVVTATGSQQIGRSGSQGAVYVLNGGQYLVADGANIEMARSTGADFLTNGLPAGVTNWVYHTNVNAYALMVISNPGSYVQARAVFVGGDAVMSEPAYGFGDVIVADNAHLKTVNTSAGITLRPRSSLTVSDALVESRTLIMQSNTTLRIELGKREHLAQNHHTNAYIRLTGALNLTGTVSLELAFLDNFDTSGLTIGSEISLITMGSQTGSFNGWESGVTMVSHGGYDFLYNEYSDEIYLSVIPEPGSLGLIGVGLGLAAVLRRRRK
ncbi:MAG: PEP-CTERM sorting domain-containing protein [Kiritimatiellia bacterium]|nr:PEP-CTERM sorting domain-containing protein [Kiritimatiellia bacterium]